MPGQRAVGVLDQPLQHATSSRMRRLVADESARPSPPAVSSTSAVGGARSVLPLHPVQESAARRRLAGAHQIPVLALPVQREGQRRIPSPTVKTVVQRPRDAAHRLELEASLEVIGCGLVTVEPVTFQQLGDLLLPVRSPERDSVPHHWSAGAVALARVQFNGQRPDRQLASQLRSDIAHVE